MKKIIIETVSAEDQRYPTAGDYWEDKDAIHITITDQVSDDKEFLIALHEMVEFWLTRTRGISEEEITRYDIEWEGQAAIRNVVGDEPGNEPGCIYGMEHRFAENIERQVAHELGIDWHDYDNNIKI